MKIYFFRTTDTGNSIIVIRPCFTDAVAVLESVGYCSGDYVLSKVADVPGRNMEAKEG